MSPVATIALVLIFARVTGELWLSGLNRRHVHANAKEVPTAFRGMIDEATYCRSVDYTLTKNRFGDVVTIFDAILLVGIYSAAFCHGRLRNLRQLSALRCLQWQAFFSV